MWNLIGSGVGLAGNLLGGLKANKQAERQAQRALSNYLQAKTEQQGQYAVGRGYMQQGLGAIQQGYGNAQAALGSAGIAAHQRIADTTKLATGAADARSIGRGLYNSTVGQGLRAQAAYQGGRAHADLSGRIAQLRAQLYGQQGMATANQQNALGQSHMQQGNAALQVAQGMANTGYTPTHDAGPWAGVGAFGAMLSKYLGGGQVNEAASGMAAQQAVSNMPWQMPYRIGG